MPLIEIQVTEEHIKDGKRTDCKFCPVALAIRDKVKSEYIVDITEIIFIYNSQRLIKLDHTPETKAFIPDFDSYDPDLPACFQPKPFSFSLDIPQEYLK